jgi:hypothetical protein
MKWLSSKFIRFFLNLKTSVMDNFNPKDGVDETPETEPVIQSPASEPDHPSTSSPKVTRTNMLSAILNGLGIGLLLGILLGLSISPVVSGVIATISSLLAVFLGLNEKYLNALKSVRIGSFGLFAVVGIILGIYIRSSEPFAPSLLDKKNEYLAIGIDSITANSLLVGFVQADTGKVRRQANVLYASTIKTGDCEILMYASEDAPADETINTFNSAGGTWKEFAETYKNDLPEKVVPNALIAMRDCFCGITQSGTITMTNLDKVRKIKPEDSLSQIEEELITSGESWKAIVGKVRERFVESERKDMYLSTIKVLSHDE